MIQKFSIRSFLKENYLLYILLFIITALLYSNTLGSEFAVVDDLQGIVNNEKIRTISENMKTFSLQPILYSISYTLFGLDPLPFRVFSLLTHAITASLLSIVLFALFNQRVAWIGALLFAVHPVNSETVNWISAQFYIVQAAFAYGAIIAYLKYRSSRQIKWLIISTAIIGVELLLLRHPWVFIAPLIITALELFWRDQPLQLKPFCIFWGVLFPVILAYSIFSFTGSVENRLSYRGPGSNRTLVNQQSLTPVLVSYPYTLSSMVRLYTVPSMLTIYYDGQELDNLSYLSMYATFLLYLAAMLFLYNKNRKVFTILLILPLALAPSFSPVKVTWYITERYLYLGTGFFTGLLAYILLKAESWAQIKHLAVAAAVVVGLLYSVRTYYRNLDWKTPETLARATILSSPNSVRPYNDLAGYYVLNERYDEAKTYYQEALSVNPSATALHNLGYIYIVDELDPSIQTTTDPADETFQRGVAAMQQRDLRAAMYYFNESLDASPDSSDLLGHIAYVLTEYEQYERAEEYLDRAMELDSENAQIYFFRGYLVYKKGYIEQAKKYLEKTLELDPSHVEAKGNLDYLNKNDL